MRVSVVIPHYFEARVGNLMLATAALSAGSVVPDEILIWNNDVPLPSMIPPVQVIQSHANIGCQARFLAALAAKSDVVIFQDNDVMVEHRTIENLLTWLDVYPTGLVSLDGRSVHGASYKNWTRVRGRHVQVPVSVDVSVGRMEAVRRDRLPMILSTFPFDPSTVMDDLWFSASAKRAGVDLIVVPCGPGNGLRDLPSHGVGLSVEDKADHYAVRQRVWQEIQEKFDVWRRVG